MPFKDKERAKKYHRDYQRKYRVKKRLERKGENWTRNSQDSGIETPIATEAENTEPETEITIRLFDETTDSQRPPSDDEYASDYVSSKSKHRKRIPHESENALPLPKKKKRVTIDPCEDDKNYLVSLKGEERQWVINYVREVRSATEITQLGIQHDSETDVMICSVCRGSNPEDMIICDICCNGFHLDCLGLDEKPEERSWVCQGCETLKREGKLGGERTAYAFKREIYLGNIPVGQVFKYRPRMCKIYQECKLVFKPSFICGRFFRKKLNIDAEYGFEDSKTGFTYYDIGDWMRSVTLREGNDEVSTAPKPWKNVYIQKDGQYFSIHELVHEKEPNGRDISLPVKAEYGKAAKLGMKAMFGGPKIVSEDIYDTYWTKVNEKAPVNKLLCNKHS